MVLVALCFVAVMGIVLASYIAVCNRAMNLSNRSFQDSLSRQLAEAGIDEALRALNKNDWSNWSSVPAGMTATAWTLDTANKRASRTLTLDATKLGQGATATVKLRVDNYDALHLGAAYNSSTTYRLNDLVSYNGVWYRSLRNGNTGNTPGNLSWWVEAPISWMWSSDITYAPFDVVNYNGVWYRCVAPPPVSPGTNTYAPQLPVPATTYWVPIPTMRAWAAGTPYNVHDVVSYDGGFYRCTTAHTSSGSFAADATKWSDNVRSLSLSWTSGVVYTRGAITFHSGTWYYCINSGISNIVPSIDTAMWAPFAPAPWTSPSGDTVTAGNYYVGDYVYYGSTWYRCTTAHTYSSWVPGNWSTATPQIAWAYNSSASYQTDDIVYYSSSGSGIWYYYYNNWWNSTPTGGMHVWNNNFNYNPGDAVFYNNRWYRCLRANRNQNPSTAASYWADTPRAPIEWQPNRQYNQFDTAYYNGRWYLSLQNNNYAHSPVESSSVWWAAAPATVDAWSATKTYHYDDLVASGGVWYRCITPHTNQAPPNSSYWSVLTGATYQWNASTAYSAGSSYVNYGGVWYRCIAGNIGQSPNATAYWSALGAPVVYVEAAIAQPNNPTNITQLRATLGPAPLFPNAAGANNQLTLNGGTGTVDSYDGSVATMETNGATSTYTYGQTALPFSSSPSWNIGYAATLAAAGSNSPSLTIGSSTIVQGYVSTLSSSTSPFAPLASFGGSTVVKSYSSPPSPAVDPTRVSRTPYIPAFTTLPTPNVQVALSNWDFPMGTSLTLSSTTNLGIPGATTPSRYYYWGSLDIGTGYPCQNFNINGPIILYLYGSLRIRSGGKLEIRGPGSAEIHGSYLRTYSGSHGIFNRTQDPKKFIFIADLNSSSSTYLDNGSSAINRDFHGVIYAPNTEAPLGLEVRTGVNVYGAFSAKNITFVNEANLHYDTSLRYATFSGVDQPYTVTQWRELDTTERATMP